MQAADVVRSPKLWFELAAIQRIQAGHLEAIGDAIERNDVEDMRTQLRELTALVKHHRDTMVKLVPAMSELMAEVSE